MHKVIVLGIDGLDPHLADNFMKAGHLPNFLKLSRRGSFKYLATSNPAQSPVAWSSMALGANPGYHGIFDFISRNPKTYLPQLAFVKPNPRNILGRRSSAFLAARRGVPFWSLTSSERIPTTVLKWPVTFPSEKVSGAMLSGLGVLDIKNKLGRYTLYSTEDIAKDEERKGDVIKLFSHTGSIDSVIAGPNNAELPMKITVQEKKSTVTVELNGEVYSIKEKEWSDWIPVLFKQGLGKSFHGICRFYLDSLSPHINLYLSSIHIDPKEPAFPISYPDSYARDLVSHIGPYHTLGLPSETNGLIDNCFSEDAFIYLADALFKEREKMFWYEFDRLNQGILAFVFDAIDQLQHIFWRDMNILKKDEAYRSYKILKSFYSKMDKIIGRILDSIDDNTLLLVVSDHGFSTFKRAVNLNSWLVRHGFMTLRGTEAGQPLFLDVDWGKTKAYAVGFASIYLNIRDREGAGIINPQDTLELKRDIAKELLELRDPLTGQKVLSGVYDGSSIYTGPYAGEAPDLVFGMKPEYRASWQTALGGAPKEIIEDNTKPWRGDHLIDPQHVPGVLFINKKVVKSEPSILDIAPTILEYFQIQQPPHIEGDSLI